MAPPPAVTAAGGRVPAPFGTGQNKDRAVLSSSSLAPSPPQSDAQLGWVPDTPTTVEVVPVAPAASSRTPKAFVNPSAPPARIHSVDMVPPAVLTSASNAALGPALPELLPHLPPPLEAPKQLYKGPSEGKIIWAGKLARHGIIEIQGN